VPYEATTVPIEKSQAMIRKLLAERRASRIEFGEMEQDGVRWAAVGFAIAGRAVRMRVPHKAVADAVVWKKKRRSPRPLDVLRAELEDQEGRRIWRVLAWNLKARLEAVDENVETFEEAFLAHLLDERTGETIYEQLIRTGRVELDEPLEGRLLQAGADG
jgi:hypothetical protein